MKLKHRWVENSTGINIENIVSGLKLNGCKRSGIQRLKYVYSEARVGQEQVREENGKYSIIEVSFKMKLVAAMK